MHGYPQYPGYGPPQQQPDGSQLYQPTVAPQYTLPQQPAPWGGSSGGGYGGSPPPLQPPPQQQYGQPPGAWTPQAPPHMPVPMTPPMPGPPPGFGAPPQPQGWGAPQASPPRAPTNYIPNAAEFAAMQARAQQEAQRIAAARAGVSGPRKSRELRFPGPNGERDWQNVPVGFQREILFRMLGAAAPGAMHFHEATKHFWKSHAHPKGTGGWCPGQGCVLCGAIQNVWNAPDEAMVKRAKMARAKTHRLYQGFMCGTFMDAPTATAIGRPDLVGALDPRGIVELHRDDFDSRIRPLIYDAPSDVHMKFMELAGARGLHVFLDLARGAPFKITRKKTGPESVNIDYSVIDMFSMAGPLPQEFGFGPNGEGLEMLDLRRFAKPMSLEDQQRGCAELGFATSATAYSYSPNPQPPTQSPYAPGAQQQGQWGPPQQQPPPPPPASPHGWGQPAQQPPQQPAWGTQASQQPPPQQHQQPAPPAWGQPSAPPVLPTTGQPPSQSYAPPRSDPWTEQSATAHRPGEPPAGWQPPTPGAPPPSAQQWGPPPQSWGPPPASGPSPELAALQQQMMSNAPAGSAPSYPPPTGASAPSPGPGPAFPPPPGATAAPPPR